VGPGAVLRDLIAADVLPRVHLDHVYRNEAGIAVNAARMREGKNILDLPGCQILPAASQEVACGLIIDMVAHHTTGLTTEASPLILTPTNDGPVGRLALNALLQDMLSPSPAGSGIVQYAGTAKDPDGSLRKRSEELRRGDRVMVTRNSTELGVFNGQVGTVVDVTVPRSLDVDIDGTVVTFAGENKRMVTLAYAITGHKSQGSEAPVVIAPIFPSRVLSREWLYTVITRAREHCILIGDVAAIQACISVQRCQERRTGLVEAIAQGAN
jgi:exodeoxyribonuclease V alpha subunit